MNFTYTLNDEAHSISLESQPDGSYRAVVDGRPYSVFVRRGSDGRWLLEFDGQRHTVATAAQGENRFAHVDGQTLTFTLPEMRTASRRRGTGGSEGVAALTAQMPGKVTAVLAQVGEHIQRGQALVILEAMKMEIRVSAPGAGVVERLLVEPGQVVERGQLLAELRAADEDED